jgi:hypothetical protein
MTDINQERFQQMWRRADLQDELLASEAWQLERRIKQFELSLEVFTRNYRELDAAIVAHLPQPTSIQSIAAFSQDHAVRNEQQVEITRLLHNFVAAALTLIDTTRVFYRQEYESNGLMADYEATKDRFFAKDGPSHLVKGLRQFTQHVQLPLITSHLHLSVEPPGFAAEVRLKCQTLLRHKDCWSGVAKEYLRSQGETFDVRRLIAEYHQRITDFYNWFAGRQREIHAEEMEYLNRVRQEMSRLGRELRDPEGEPPERQGDGGDEATPLLRGQVGLLAYYQFIDEGRKDGRDKIHWESAQKRLRELQGRAEMDQE